MDNLRARVLSLFLCSAAIFVCCFVLTGSAHADSIPDPIIDTEPGCCSIDFNGNRSFFINIADVVAVNPNNCTSDPEAGITTCGTQTFITQVRVDDPFKGALVPFVLKNTSPNAIFNLDFNFGRSETAFQFPEGSTTAIFTNIIPRSTSEAIYALGAGKSPVCSAINPEGCVGNCPPESECSPYDVALSVKNLLITTQQGYVEWDVAANVAVPEPSTFALLISALPGAWVVRRSLLRR